MHRGLKRILSVTAVTVCVAALGISVQLISAASAKTGTGLANHVMKAYYAGWKYQYGAYGQKHGGTRVSDCAGLIKSYLWWTGENSNPRPSISVGGGAGAMLKSASQKGVIDYSDSSSLPRIHGLILYQPGHVGVYVGNNRAVDNRDVGYDVKYEPVFGRARKKWTMWFKLPQIHYPTNGWASFEGKKYYYENGQYIINTTRTIDGCRYTFGVDGVAKGGAKVCNKSVYASKNNSDKKKILTNVKVTAQNKKEPNKKISDKEDILSQKKSKEQKVNLSSKQNSSKSQADSNDSSAVETEETLLQRRAIKMERSFELSSEPDHSAVMSQVSLARANDLPAVPAAQQQKTTAPISASAAAFLLVMIVTAGTGIFIFSKRARRTLAAKGYVPKKDITFKKLLKKTNK